MNKLKTRCEAFRRSLHDARHWGLLDKDFVRGFNEFVTKHPHALEWKDERGHCTLLEDLHSYLFLAIHKKSQLAIFQDLVLQTPEVLVVKDVYGWTLLHYVCRDNPTALDVVCLFVQQNPDAAKATSIFRRTPLHIACGEKASLPVIRVLVDAYPRAVQICDDRGYAPLHEACFYRAPLDVIHFLSMQQPHICLHPNNNGQLPLDRAKRQQRRSGGDSHNDVIEYMTTTTTATGRVLMKRLCFRGPVPRELFEQVAAYVRSEQAAEVSVAVVAFAAAEMAVLFRRGDIQAAFRAQTGIDAP